MTGYDPYEAAPRIGLGRIVAVVVFMHVVAVAGVVTYLQFGGESELVMNSGAGTVKEVAANLEQRYVVKQGDTLLAIARAHDASVAHLKSVNDLNSSEDLKAGQELIIPQEVTPSHTGSNEPLVAELHPYPAVTTETNAKLGSAKPAETNRDQSPLKSPERQTIPREAVKLLAQEERSAPVITDPALVVEADLPEASVPEPEKPVVLRATPIVMTDEGLGETEETSEANEASASSSEQGSQVAASAPSFSSEPIVSLVVKPNAVEELAQEDPKPLVKPDPVEIFPVNEIPKALPYDPRKENQSRASTRRAPVTYEVQRGDTFYSISKKFEVSVQDLMRVNRMSNARDLRWGKVIEIP